MLRILESSLEEELLLSLLLPDPELDEERDTERCGCFDLDLLRDLSPGWLGERDLLLDLSSDRRDVDVGSLGELERDSGLLLSLHLSASPPPSGLGDLLGILLSLRASVGDWAQRVGI